MCAVGVTHHVVVEEETLEERESQACRKEAGERGVNEQSNTPLEKVTTRRTCIKKAWHRSVVCYP